MFVEAGSPSSSESWSASLHLDCEEPFDVVSVQTGPVWVVFDVLEMVSEFAIAAPGAATVVTDGNIDVEVGGPGTAWLWSGGVSQGQWEVTTPEGVETYGIGPGDTLHTVAGGTGLWTIALDGSTNYGSGIWGAVAGPFVNLAPPA